MNDTIAAIATPCAPSAIGILRLSGPGAVSAAAAVFRSASGRRLEDCPSRTLCYGTLLGPDGRAVDQVLATISRAPHSYTGENTAELQCHGSPTVLALGLEALFAHGVRQAEPGEFTKRAFLNGRLDLMQAEAVADLIDAETPAAAYQAAGQLSGALSRRVRAVYDGLVDVMAHFHAVLDYPDEDIDPFRSEAIAAALERARQALADLLSTYQRGRYLAGGIPCVLAGRPNAGKSSLLNALAGYERAIVTDFPGTTRDTVEARCRLGGFDLRVIDTAGLRCATDPAERAGVERSWAALREAALIFVLVDRAVPPVEEDAALLERAATLAPTLLVWTKSDLPAAAGCVERPPQVAEVSLSARTGAGLEALEAAVSALLSQGGTEEAAGELLTNVRQAQAARRALASVERAEQALARAVTPDALLTDVEEALRALGELTGSCVREDVTARIFERFCVGK